MRHTFMRRWFRWNGGRSHSCRLTRYTPRPRPTLRIEALEDRALPAILFTVNTLADGPVNLSDSALTLRDALFAANSGDVINFEPSLFTAGPGTITLNQGRLLVATDLTISGPGASLLTINANHASRVLNVSDGGDRSDKSVTLSGLTISGGSFDHTALGSALGGGIFNDEILTIQNCTITDNTSGIGGGIFNGGVLTVRNSTISGNEATAHDLDGEGGGGIANNATLTVENCTISGNLADGHGGGIRNRSGLLVQNSTISGNLANDDGGGIWNSGTVIVRSSTVTQNHANNDNINSGRGGGIFIEPGVVSPMVTLENTIVAQNFKGSDAAIADDINGDPVDASSRNNLIGTGGSGDLINGMNDNRVGVADPGLGPLASNGGPTQTHALLPGSPAIDAGNNSLAPGSADQRGTPFLRTAGGVADIGAFEAQTLNLVVDTDVDEDDGDIRPGDLSLREALNLTNANPGPDTISFASFFNDPRRPRVITLVLGQLGIRDDLTLTGPASGVVINGNNASRVFDVSDFSATVKTVTMSGMIISAGNAGNSFGGGILNRENLAVLNCTISGNFAGTLGGGIYNTDTGTLTVRTSTLSSNTAGKGGGIANDGTSTVQRCTLNANQTTGDDDTGGGGGIFNAGTLTVQNSTLSGNHTADAGGGIFSAGTLFVQNCTIVLNHTNRDGGPGIVDQPLDHGGGIAIRGSAIIHNTIVDNNLFFLATDEIFPDDVFLLPGAGPVSGANNLIGATNGGFTNGANGNQVGEFDPKLGPLANNGGPTETHALLPGSPAFNAGNNAQAAGSTDQHGVPRIAGGQVDIGAVEQVAVLAGGDLLIFGSAGDDDILVERNGTTNLLDVTYNGILVGSFSLSAITGKISVDAREGNDTVKIIGVGKHCELSGGPGDDVLVASAGNDTLLGGSGNDSLTAGAGDDELFGGDGDDSLRGGQGNDTIDGGAGSDSLFETGDVNFALTNSKLTGLGADTLVSIEAATLTGGAGNNVLDASAFTRSVTLNGSGGDDTLIGGAGNDTLNGGGGNDRITGGPGRDVLNGGDGDDALFSNDGLGNDTVLGGSGNDTATADAGDLVDLGAGQDGIVFHGTAGNDAIRVSRQVGPNGPEVVFLLNGRTTVIPYLNGETVFVFAGKGNDHVVMDDSAAFRWTAEFHGEEGNDHLMGSLLDDVLDGGPGNDWLEGGAGDDVLRGGAGNDRLYGGAGNDHINGGAGNDVLQGKAGDDELIGGPGRDMFGGGAGADHILARDAAIDVIFADAFDWLVTLDSKDKVHLI